MGVPRRIERRFRLPVTHIALTDVALPCRVHFEVNIT
jgi:hypothetical protein